MFRRTICIARRRGPRCGIWTTLNERGSGGAERGHAISAGGRRCGADRKCAGSAEGGRGALQPGQASHDAGVGTNLDVLRARVQLQTQQQTLINAENIFAKDKIALNRLMGMPADRS